MNPRFRALALLALFLNASPSLHAGVRSWLTTKVAEYKAGNKQEAIEELTSQLVKTKTYLSFQSTELMLRLQSYQTAEQNYKKRIISLKPQNSDNREVLRKTNEIVTLIPLSDVYETWRRCLKVLGYSADKYNPASTNKSTDKNGVGSKLNPLYARSTRTIVGLKEIHNDLVKSYGGDEPSIKALYEQIMNLEKQTQAEAIALYNYMIDSMGVNKKELQENPKATGRRIRLIEKQASKGTSEFFTAAQLRALVEGEKDTTDKVYQHNLDNDYAGISCTEIAKLVKDRSDARTILEDTIQQLAKKYFIEKAPYVDYLFEQIELTTDRIVKAGFTIIAARMYVKTCGEEVDKAINGIYKIMQSAVDRADDTVRIRATVKLEDNKQVGDTITGIFEGKSVTQSGTSSNSITTVSLANEALLSGKHQDTLAAYIKNFDPIKSNVLKFISKFKTQFQVKLEPNLVKALQENPLAVRKKSDSKETVRPDIKTHLYVPWAKLEMIEAAFKGISFNWNDNSSTISFKETLEKIAPNADDTLFTARTKKAETTSAIASSVGNTSDQLTKDAEFTKMSSAELEKDLLEQDKARAKTLAGRDWGALKLSTTGTGRSLRKQDSYGSTAGIESNAQKLLLLLIVSSQQFKSNRAQLIEDYKSDKQKTMAKSLLADELEASDKLMKDQAFKSAVSTLKKGFSHRYSIVYNKQELEELMTAMKTIETAIITLTPQTKTFDENYEKLRNGIEEVNRLYNQYTVKNGAAGGGYSEDGDALVNLKTHQKFANKRELNLDAEFNKVIAAAESFFNNFTSVDIDPLFDQTDQKLILYTVSETALKTRTQQLTKIRQAIEFFCTALSEYYALQHEFLPYGDKPEAKQNLIDAVRELAVKPGEQLSNSEEIVRNKTFFDKLELQTVLNSQWKDFNIPDSVYTKQSDIDTVISNLRKVKENIAIQGAATKNTKKLTEAASFIASFVVNVIKLEVQCIELKAQKESDIASQITLTKGAGLNSFVTAVTDRSNESTRQQGWQFITSQNAGALYNAVSYLESSIKNITSMLNISTSDKDTIQLQEFYEFRKNQYSSFNKKGESTITANREQWRKELEAHIELENLSKAAAQTTKQPKPTTPAIQPSLADDTVNNPLLTNIDGSTRANSAPGALTNTMPNADSMNESRQEPKSTEWTIFKTAFITLLTTINNSFEAKNKIRESSDKELWNNVLSQLLTMGATNTWKFITEAQAKPTCRKIYTILDIVPQDQSKDDVQAALFASNTPTTQQTTCITNIVKKISDTTPNHTTNPAFTITTISKESDFKQYSYATQALVWFAVFMYKQKEKFYEAWGDDKSRDGEEGGDASLKATVIMSTLDSDNISIDILHKTLHNSGNFDYMTPFFDMQEAHSDENSSNKTLDEALSGMLELLSLTDTSSMNAKELDAKYGMMDVFQRQAFATSTPIRRTETNNLEKECKDIIQQIGVKAGLYTNEDVKSIAPKSIARRLVLQYHTDKIGISQGATKFYQTAIQPLVEFNHWNWQAQENDTYLTKLKTSIETAATYFPVNSAYSPNPAT